MDGLRGEIERLQAILRRIDISSSTPVPMSPTYHPWTMLLPRTLLPYPTRPSGLFAMWSRAGVPSASLFMTTEQGGVHRVQMPRRNDALSLAACKAYAFDLGRTGDSGCPSGVDEKDSHAIKGCFGHRSQNLFELFYRISRSKLP